MSIKNSNKQSVNGIGAPMIIVDECWDVLFASHPVRKKGIDFLVQGAEQLRKSNHHPVIITAMPVDDKRHAVDGIFQEASEQPMGTSTKRKCK